MNKRRQELVLYTQAMQLTGNLDILGGKIIFITGAGASNLIAKFKLYGVRYFLHYFGVLNLFKFLLGLNTKFYYTKHCPKYMKK